MENIKRFLETTIKYENKCGDENRNGNGNGYGDGNGDGSKDGNGYGNGYGDGSGDGNGNGYGYGSGSGNGDRNGNGYGDGYGNIIVSVNGRKVYNIDFINTIIIQVKNNIAKGFILNNDFTQTPCFIVKQDDYFAHGKTLKEAYNAVLEKVLNTLSISERISKFHLAFPNKTIKYPAINFYNWHSILTNSCDLGKLSFCKNNNINVDNDKFTVSEFIELTKNYYKGDIIKQLNNES
jgi:hypothetical protein